MPVSRSALIASVVLLGCGNVIAADLPAPSAHTIEQASLPGQPYWSFTAGTYLWAASMSGNVGQFGLQPVSVEASFSDTLKHLDFGATLVAELRYGDYGLFNDFMYVKLSGESATPRGVVANSVSLDSSNIIYTAAGEYRLIDDAKGSLDLLAGARVWSVDTDISFHGGILDGQTFSEGDTWVDALAGVKGRLNLTPEFYLSGWAMAGGGSSDFMWDLWGGLGYQFSDKFSALIGYRASGVNYDNGKGFVFDVVQQGPMIGAAYRF
ncbi:hypothetical protein ACVINZ_006457 [Mesorhizobium jarvisii]